MDVVQYARNGMHKDNDISAQPKDTYRDALNGNLISGHGNFFAFKTAKGNKLSLELPTTVSNTLDRIVIGWVESKDFLYLFATTDETPEGGYGEILKVTINKATTLGTPSLVYSSNNLMFTSKHPIGNEAVYIEESIDVGRLYWTDNFNPPRVINVLDSNVASIDVALLNITPGLLPSEINFGGTIRDQYGVILSGQLESGLYRYTYRLISSSTGAQTNWFPLTNPVTIGPSKTGTKLDDYIKYEGGTQGTDGSGIPDGSPNELTSKAIRFFIKDLDTKYDQIQVGAFFYNGFDTNPNGTIIKYAEFTGTTYEFEHIGNEFVGVVTPGEVEITTADIEKVKTISTNKNRLMFGNITESAEIDYKDVAKDITHQSFIYTYITDETELIFNNVSSGSTLSGDTAGIPNSGLPYSNCGFYGHTAARGYGEDSGDPTIPGQVVGGGGIRPGQWYGVWNSSSSIQYPPGGLTYSHTSPNGRFFMGQVGNPDYKIITGTGHTPVKAYVRVKKFKSQNSTDIYNNVNIPYEFLDNKGVFNNYYTQGYWRDETYRFALIVWDKYMRPSFAEWIDDVKMPEIYGNADVGDSYNTTYNDTNKKALLSYIHGNSTSGGRQVLRNLGIQFNNIQLGKIATQLGILESELPEYISGFSIVRAPADESIVAQGMLLPIATTGEAVTANDSLYKGRWFPLNWPLLPESLAPGFGGLSYGPDGNQNIGTNDRKYGYLVSPECSFDFRGLWKNGTTSTQEIEDKFFTHVKIIGKYIGVMPPDLLSNPLGNRNMLVATNGTPIFGCTRFLKWTRFTGHSGDLTPINSIRPFGFTATAATFDPKNPNRVFINQLLGANIQAPGYNYNISTPANNSYGCVGAIVSLEDALPQLINNSPVRTNWIEGQGPGYAYWINIIKEKGVPYEGINENSKSNTNYISTGHFQPINADVYAENGNSWTFDEVQVFGGDCYVNLFDVTTAVQNANNHNAPGHPPNLSSNMYSLTDVFPVESRVNTGMRQGRHANKDGIMSGSWLLDPDTGNYTWTQSDENRGGFYGGGGVNPTGVQSNNPESFVYNEAYSQMTSNVFYAATPFNFNAKLLFPNRVRYSLQKTANEPIDSFRSFLLNNFRDVDILNRGITNLRVRGENLFYWQERAVGYLPINERVTVATSLGEPTEIGIGGVMTRYDERTDFYGNQHKHGLIETPDGFIWIDRQNRALLNMNLNGQVAELSSMKGMMSFLGPLINDATLDNPIDKETNGFTGIYDARTKNTYITFVGVYYATLSGTIFNYYSGTTYAMIFSGHTIATFPFEIGDAITITEGTNTYNTTISTLQEVPLGVLIATPISFTLVTGTPITIEGYAPIDSQTISFNHLNSQFISRYSFKPCMYARFNDLMFTVPNFIQGNRKEIYVHEEGDLGEFYKSVYDTDITLIVNPSIETPKVFDNIETNIGPNGPSSIEYSTSFQSATDLDIENNPEYKFRNRDWMGTVARDEEARMRDHYMQIKLIKNNKLNGSSTVSSNKEIKFLSLKTILRPTY